jgi:hypothetical protein
MLSDVCQQARADRRRDRSHEGADRTAREAHHLMVEAMPCQAVRGRRAPKVGTVVFNFLKCRHARTRSRFATIMGGTEFVLVLPGV